MPHASIDDDRLAFKNLRGNAGFDLVRRLHRHRFAGNTGLTADNHDLLGRKALHHDVAHHADDAFRRRENGETLVTATTRHDRRNESQGWCPSELILDVPLFQ